MSDGGNPSHWDVAALGTIVIGVLGVFGKGIKEMWGHRREARRTRAKGLQEWEDKLGAREAQLESAIEGRLRKLEADNEQQGERLAALRWAFEIVASELQLRDPHNLVLRRAWRVLARVFPHDPTIIDPGEHQPAIERRVMDGAPLRGADPV